MHLLHVSSVLPISGFAFRAKAYDAVIHKRMCLFCFLQKVMRIKSSHLWRFVRKERIIRIENFTMFLLLLLLITATVQAKVCRFLPIDGKFSVLQSLTVKYKGILEVRAVHNKS